MITNKSKIDLAAMDTISYGVYLVSASYQNRLNAQVSTVAFQVTSEPIKIAICLNKNNFTHQLVKSSKAFGIFVLSYDAPADFIKSFGFRSGASVDKLSGITYLNLETASPLITEHAISILDLELFDFLDAGTHTVFIGSLLAANKLSDHNSLSYRYYTEVLKEKILTNHT